MAPAARQGLSSAEVDERVAAGRTNRPSRLPQRSRAQIVRANVLTPVNGIMLALFALILSTGHWRDGLFVGVVFSNSVVGITQEIRARRELERLEVINEATATVIRDGDEREVPVAAVVVDDLLAARPGHQIPVDGEVLDAHGLEVDESLLSGESEPIARAAGEQVRSGSFVVAGSGRFRATEVGEQSYAAGLAAEARRFSVADSALRRGIDRVLRWLFLVIPVTSLVLLVSLLGSEDRWQDALQGVVAAAVAMVPDGLVLLTSVAFLAGVVQLARRQALTKQLSTVETLARVDILCLDKTGTITTGELSLGTVRPSAGWSDPDVRTTLAAMAAADPAPNATMAAVAAGVGTAPDWPVTATAAFSSDRKWSSVTFGPRTFFLGAPDAVLEPGDPDLEAAVDLAAAGRRVLAVAVASSAAGDGDREAVALLVMRDEVRPDAGRIIGYFLEEGVALKVISGDDPQTVGAIAAEVGVPGADRPVDARLLTELGEEELGDALEADSVFGRVTPHQKQAMVVALRRRGHVVAMTGDGVNDVLALKEADIGVAMGTGSPAARAVADLVLLDSAFATLPDVVAEGRRVINNVERVSNLFLTKVAYAVILALVVGFAGIPFPLLPRQLTLIGTFSIGVPGFFLALSPEIDLVHPGFLRRVLRFSVPAGVVAGAITLAVYELARRSSSIALPEARTAATVTLLGLGLAILLVASRPLRPWKVALTAAMGVAYAGIFGIGALRSYF